MTHSRVWHVTIWSFFIYLLFMIHQFVDYTWHLFHEVNIHILTHRYFTNTIHMRNVTHSHVWHVTIESWFFNILFIHITSSMRSTSPFLRTNSLRIPLICTTWLIHMCDMSRLNHDFSTYYLFISPLPRGQHPHSYAPILYEYHSYAQHDSFTCVTCHDLFIICLFIIYINNK